MVTNIPHGISQSNRAHPLFIIVRRHAETEENQFRKATTILVQSVIFHILASFIPAVIHGELWMASAMFVAFLFDLLAIRFVCFVYPKNMVFPKINRMIFSDDYSQSAINYENVTNLIGECKESIGELRGFMTCIFNLNYIFLLWDIAMAIYLVIKILLL